MTMLQCCTCVPASVRGQRAASKVSAALDWPSCCTQELLLHVLQLLVAGVVGAFFWWTRFASDSLKATIEESGAPVLACLGGCAGWVQDKFAQLTGRQRREAEGAFYDPLSGENAWTPDA